MYVAIKVEELPCLSRLETLSCSFKDSVELHKFLILLKGEPRMGLYFKVGSEPILCVGFTDELFNDDDEDLHAEEDGDLTMVLLYNININEAGIPNYFQEIVIVKCNEARSLCDFSPIKGVSKLEDFSFKECDRLEFVCSLQGQGVLKNVKYMELLNLENLSVLFKKEEANVAANYDSCFSNLTRFMIQGCPSIKCLFPFHLLQNMKNLKKLCVVDSRVMEEICETEGDDTENENGYLARVCIVKFKDLPELKRICVFLEPALLKLRIVLNFVGLEP